MEQFYTLDELVKLNSEGKLRSKNELIQNLPVYCQNNNNSSSFRDVHIYDTKLQFIPTSSFDKKSKEELFAKFVSILINRNSINMTYIISRGGYDGANKIERDDLLASILSRKMSKDIFFLLEEQLADNFQLGQCCQGTTTRLLQIYDMTIT